MDAVVEVGKASFAPWDALLGQPAAGRALKQFVAQHDRIHGECLNLRRAPRGCGKTIAAGLLAAELGSPERPHALRCGELLGPSRGLAGTKGPTSREVVKATRAQVVVVEERGFVS